MKASKKQIAVRHFLNIKNKGQIVHGHLWAWKFLNTFSLQYQLEKGERERLVGKGNERKHVWYQNWMERDYTGCNYSLRLSSNMKPSPKLLGGDGLLQLHVWLSLKRGKFFFWAVPREGSSSHGLPRNSRTWQLRLRAQTPIGKVENTMFKKTEAAKRTRAFRFGRWRQKKWDGWNRKTRPLFCYQTKICWLIFGNPVKLPFGNPCQSRAVVVKAQVPYNPCTKLLCTDQLQGSQGNFCLCNLVPLEQTCPSSTTLARCQPALLARFLLWGGDVHDVLRQGVWKILCQHLTSSAALLKTGCWWLRFPACWEELLLPQHCALGPLL